MLKQHFIVEGKYLGNREVQYERRGFSVVIPASLAHFCNTCGRVWATSPIEDEHGRTSRWHVMNRTCSRHAPEPFALYPTGLVTSHWDRDNLQSLPDDVVQWEFNRYMEFL